MKRFEHTPVRSRPAAATPSAAARTIHHRIPARVFLFSDCVCASACLDFADIALHVPGTLLIGADTSADGLLMEVRDQMLPSGLASVTLPMKVYRARARGALEAYRVDIPYDRENWHLGMD